MRETDVRFRLLVVAFLLLPVALGAQDRRVTGVVTRQGPGTPLEGAEVSVLSPARGLTARTGADGRYAISVPAGDVRLQVRMIGFRRVEFTLVASQNTADFALTQRHLQTERGGRLWADNHH